MEGAGRVKLSRGFFRDFMEFDSSEDLQHLGSLVLNIWLLTAHTIPRLKTYTLLKSNMPSP